MSRYQELRNNPIDNVGHLVPNFVALHVCKISNADMFAATQEKYHAARRWVLLRCCAVCCGG